MQVCADGDHPRANHALFRVLPEVWDKIPTYPRPPVLFFSVATPAVTHNKPSKSQLQVELVEVGDDIPAATIKLETASTPATPVTPSKSDDLTWDDLVKQGALLGVEGWTDRAQSKL